MSDKLQTQKCFQYEITSLTILHEILHEKEENEGNLLKLLHFLDNRRQLIITKKKIRFQLYNNNNIFQSPRNV